MGKLNSLLSAAIAASVLAAPGADAAEKAATPATVTLISGDRVTVVGSSVSVTPAPGRERVLFHRRTERDHVRVVPDDALPLLAAGRLDEQLFDVTALVEQGYDDAHTAELPLLRTGGVRTASEVSKKDAATFWRSLSGPQASTAGKIWLDARVKIALDQSVPMTNAPAAWEQGVRGEGVKVAVLDTGVDAKHPELAVAESRGFTDAGESDVQDRQGHGTHVASTVAGRGAKNTGVAPAASLMVGKVLDDRGYGQTSWIIAGMEWAARSGARVVNMSLGADMRTDGTDPLSQAVNDLTAETGALFVVAAGNNGWGPYTIGSPGSATSALTVGSVEKNGALSGFSAKGPRFGDDAVKPDITAPGGAIVAARAEGTLADVAVDDLHARLSGTSMATPHVAGAAALLAQRNPAWKANELKAALMGSAKPGGSVYEHGAGLVQVEFSPVLTSVGSVSFGKLPYPPSGKPVTREVTYANTGPAVSLRLSTDMGAVTPPVLEVPAGGSATASVSFTPTAPGRFEGALTSALPDGSAGPRVVLGATQSPEEYDLTLKTLRRDGKPASLPNLILTDGERVDWPVVGEQGVTLRVRPGTYTVFGTQPERTPEFVAESVITFARGGIDVHADTTVVIDGADSKPVDVALSGESLARVLSRSDGAELPGRGGIASQGPRDMPFYGMSRDAGHVEYRTSTIAARPQVLLSAGDFEPVVGYGYFSTHFTKDVTLPVATTTADSKGKLLLLRDNGNSQEQIREAVAAGAVAVVFPTGRFGAWGLDAPIPVLGASESSFVRLGTVPAVSVRAFGTSPYSYHVQFTEKGVPNGKKYSVSQRDLARVDVTYRSPGVTSTGFSNGVPTTFPQQRTEYYTPGKWHRQTSFTESSWAPQVSPEYAFERGKSYRHTWFPAVFAPNEPQLFREGNVVRVGVDVFSTTTSTDFGDPEVDRGSLTLSRDGQVFGTSRMPSFGYFENVPPGPLKLEMTASRTQPWWGLSTRIDSAWTFRTTPLAVKYGVPDNTMDRHRTFTVSFTRPAKTVRVWSSVDDGRTWTALQVHKAGANWLVLPSGARGAHVSLRVAATAPNGDTVDQTVVRAYAQR
ncbi:S8 family serine peptidase [Lentzea tibetensis]|uniref:S8 family serine peptidase n=1 Tax=Lentzea tibetensis TaxID=2591470 RepID=A0A563EPI8_9PSEU|nr:S8 family serine peptidase [Lentzea tibetensis]TWP49287.1 S8 family serine peptidase [Lentzea tibetensis]